MFRKRFGQTMFVAVSLVVAHPAQLHAAAASTSSGQAASTSSGQAASTSSGQAASTGSGRAYPNKPVRLIVPYPPGGSVDFTGRELAQKLSEAWGQQVVLDNRVNSE